jgi:radical SAM protein (TIGR01212 family)
MKKRILTFGRYLKNSYGVKVYKVPISLDGFTCPNIDGTVARGGCTFCDNDSFSPNIGKNKSKFFLNSDTTQNILIEKQLQQLEEQFITTSKKLQISHKAKKFIIYFQSFTNTYAPTSTLEKLYDRALEFDNVVGISIGTRADSVSHEMLEFLIPYSKKTELWLEYGIQSIYNKTLQKINRGETFEDVKNIVQKSIEKGFNVCAHLIFGLPDEDEDMMYNTYKEVISWKIKSIKFHPCYVVNNTALANDILNNKFTPLDMQQYTNILIRCLKSLPDDISVQRISAGIDNSSLLAPKWCFDKNQYMKYARKKMAENNIIY